MQIQPFHGIRPSLTKGYSLVNQSVTVISNLGEEASRTENSTISELLRKNFLIRDNKRYFYVCRTKCKNIESVGVIAKAAISDVSTSIFKHEESISQKKERYVNYFIEHKYQHNPVILIHKNSPEIAAELQKITKQAPVSKIEEQSKTYELWQISDVNKRFSKLYARLQYSYIADGHHRVAAISELQDWFPHFSAYLLAENQVISKKLCWVYKTNLDTTNLLNSLENKFLLEQHSLNATDDSFLLYIDRAWYRLESKTKKINGTDIYNRVCSIRESIDCAIKETNQKIFSFNHYDFDSITINKFKRSVDNNKGSFLFVIPSVHASELIKTISGNLFYPPHSTYFDPKLPNNLMTFSLEENNC